MPKLTDKELSEALKKLQGKYTQKPKGLHSTPLNSELTPLEKQLARILQSKSYSETLLSERRKLAVASHMSVASLNGYVKAIASSANPLHTELEVMITDFEPNHNKQGIKRSEAANILRTALNSPLKIAFDGSMALGHKNASAIGTIVEVADQSTKIIGRAVIWDNEHEDVAQYVKATAAIYTSWEIYYADSTIENGIEWLQGCVFAGLAIVDNPAYGKERARAHILA